MSATDPDSPRIRQMRLVVEAGAELVAPPTRTPWDSLNSRLAGPAGLQLTVFQELSPGDPPI